MKIWNGFKWYRIIFVLLPVIAGGCVSKGTFEAQIDKSQSLTEQLRMEQQKSTDLKSELEESLKASNRMKSEIADLESQLVSEKELRSQTEKKYKTEAGSLKKEFKKEKAEWTETYSDLQSILKLKDLKINRLENTIKLSQKKAAIGESKHQKYDEIQKKLISKLEGEIKEGIITISQLKGRLSVEIVDKILFASGSTEIKEKGKEVLNKFSEILKDEKKHNIRIEGHTDNVPLGLTLQRKFPTNWELSAFRATQVVRYLISKGVAPEKLVAMGQSKYRPVASNDTREGRKRNRRIEIVFFQKNLQSIKDSPE